MNSFTIKEIEQLCGIKAHTLRVWEQRYSIITPKRKASKHRTFDNEDLKHILRITFLYNAGLKISKIASLSPTELKDMTSFFVEKENAQLTYKLYINQLISATLDFDEKTMDAALQDAIEKMGVEKTVTDIIYPFLEKIGMLWLTGKAIPAQEHFSCNIIRQKLVRAIEETPLQPENSNTFLLFTPENEFHEIPLLLMYYLLKKSGQHVYYVGTNIPIADIEYLVQRKDITHIYFHLITHLAKSTTDAYVQEIAKKLKSQQIIVSGPAVKYITTKHANVRLLRSLKEMLSFGKKQPAIL